MNHSRSLQLAGEVLSGFAGFHGVNQWLRSRQSGYALPVLKHGPRSLTRAQALGC